LEVLSEQLIAVANVEPDNHIELEIEI
jgi:hypothetical protein